MRIVWCGPGLSSRRGRADSDRGDEQGRGGRAHREVEGPQQVRGLPARQAAELAMANSILSGATHPSLSPPVDANSSYPILSYSLHPSTPKPRPSGPARAPFGAVPTIHVAIAQRSPGGGP
jgi:hypothetical protein